MDKKYIVSYGGGVDSTAMLIGLKQKGLPVDYILFADTGGEHPETYAYVQYLNVWLVKNGLPEIITVKYKTKDGIELTLEQDVINNNTLPAIAFGWKTCSQKFKIAPIEKFLKENIPLIEWKWDRKKAKEIIEAEGLCLPTKSSCFFCPNMNKHEVLKLSDDLKKRAINIEANASKVAELKGLGRQYSWTDLIKADEKQIKMFEDSDWIQTPCECMD